MNKNKKYIEEDPVIEDEDIEDMDDIDDEPVPPKKKQQPVRQQIRQPKPQDEGEDEDDDDDDGNELVTVKMTKNEIRLRIQDLENDADLKLFYSILSGQRKHDELTACKQLLGLE